jgi:hypothetical protein
VLLNDYGAQSGSLSISVDLKGYNWKEVEESLGPYLIGRLGGPDAAPRRSQIKLELGKGAGWGTWVQTKDYWTLTFRTHSLPLVFAPWFCSLSLHPVFAPCLCTLSLHPVFAPCLCSLSLHPVFAPCLCTLSLHPVFAPCFLGEIVCVTNEICLCQVDGPFYFRRYEWQSKRGQQRSCQVSDLEELYTNGRQ